MRAMLGPHQGCCEEMVTLWDDIQSSLCFIPMTPHRKLNFMKITSFPSFSSLPFFFCLSFSFYQWSDTKLGSSCQRRWNFSADLLCISSPASESSISYLLIQLWGDSTEPELGWRKSLLFVWDAMNMDWDSLSQMEILPFKPCPSRRAPWGATQTPELGISAPMSEGDQTSPSDCACDVQICAAPGIWAYLPPNPVLSFSDSFLCSYTLLILSHGFRPDPVEKSGNKDTLPRQAVFPAHNLSSQRCSCPG